MAIWAQAQGSELRIHVEGRFDFGSHEEFRAAYQQHPVEFVRYQVEMRKTTYLDSSALGMLLLLREHAGGETAEICLANCNADVRRILNISNFEQLFTIE